MDVNFELKPALTKGAELYTEFKKAQQFDSKYGIVPPQVSTNLALSMQELAESVPLIDNPTTQDQVYQAELKRRLTGETFLIKKDITGEPWAFEDVMEIYDIKKEDISGLRPWLEEYKAETLESLNRLYKNASKSEFIFPVSSDIPQVRKRAENFAEKHITKYFNIISSLLERTSGLDLNPIEVATTTVGRSYFNSLKNTLAIAAPAVVYTTIESPLNLNIKELLSLIGHEGMGHALNTIASNDIKHLPFFLGQFSSITCGTQESVAQHFETEIFKELENSPETQKELGIKKIFPEIIQEAMDENLLKQYNLKFYQYALTVLADKTIAVGDSPNTNGSLQKKHEALIDVALNPNVAGKMIDNNINNFDRAGNLNSSLVAELRYAAQPVQRALEVFKQKKVTDKTLINKTLLTGYWTPDGFVQNAKLVANNAKIN